MLTLTRSISAVFCGATLLFFTPVSAEYMSDKYGESKGYPLAPHFVLSEARDEWGVAEYSGERFSGNRQNFYSGKNDDSWVHKGDKPPEELSPLQIDWGRHDPSKWVENNAVLAVAIYKEGHLIYEKYQYKRTPEHRFNSQSMAKTLTAMTMGKAVEDGLVDIDQPVQKYLPYLEGTPLGLVSVRNHLKMSSGSDFRWEATGSAGQYAWKKFMPPSPNCEKLIQRYRLDVTRRPCGVDVREIWKGAGVSHKQGERFNYDPLSSDILSAVIGAVYGKPLSKVFQDEVWAKMGVEDDAFWQFMWATPERITSGANTFHARLRDWVRLGKLFLEEGRSNPLSAKWLTQMVSDKVSVKSWHLEEPDMLEYGYQTWIAKKYFAMVGYRGQQISIHPESKTLMVVFSLEGEWKRGGLPFFNWLTDQKLSDLKAN
jgi:CubicO group peptidase (beta-lactamase class C family)